MIKVKELVETNIEMPLPIIMEFSEVFDYQPRVKQNPSENYHVESRYYQTSKLSCKSSSKPLYVKKNGKLSI